MSDANTLFVDTVHRLTAVMVSVLNDFWPGSVTDILSETVFCIRDSSTDARHDRDDHILRLRP